jgi:hypothetical protein
MLALAWKDKRTVSVLSTSHNAQTQPYAPRRRESEPISKPNVNCDYTAKMGGVDIADRYTLTYSFGWKSKKWWRKLFFWLLDVSVVNSFILYNMQQQKPIRQRKYRKVLIMELVGNVCNTNSRK